MTPLFDDLAIQYAIRPGNTFVFIWGDTEEILPGGLVRTTKHDSVSIGWKGSL